jgi:hypothetical protein
VVRIEGNKMSFRQRVSMVYYIAGFMGKQMDYPTAVNLANYFSSEQLDRLYKRLKG